MKIKALSLWQPWASLIAVGAKKYETRSWKTDYRGPLLICASKKILTAFSLRELGEKKVWRDGLLAHDYMPGELFQGEKPGYFAGYVIEILPYGKAVAVVDLTDCIPTEKIMERWLNAQGPAEISTEINFGDFSPGRFAWKLENVRAIEPFTVKGRQGLFEVEISEGLV